MELNYLILRNAREVKQALDLNLKMPDYDYDTRCMVIDVNDIIMARITIDNFIEIKLHNDCYSILYEEHIWKVIVKTINEREKRRDK